MRIFRQLNGILKSQILKVKKYLRLLAERRKYRKSLLIKKQGLLKKAISSNRRLSKKESKKLQKINEALVLSKFKISRTDFIIFTLGLIIIGVLFFGRVWSTEIELNFTVSSVGLRIEDNNIIINDTRLNAMSVVDANDISIPESELKKDTIITSKRNSGTSVKLLAVNNQEKSGSITLNSILVVDGSYISIQTSDIPNEYIIDISPKNFDIEASVYQNLEIKLLQNISGLDDSLNSYYFPLPKLIKMKPVNKANYISFIPYKNQSNLLGQSLKIDSLDFSKTSHNRIGFQIISSISEGMLVYKSLADKTIKIREGQQLKLENLKGEIFNLDLNDGKIEISFHGTVNRITSGNDNNSFNLTPTFLEYLIQNFGVNVLWVAATTLITLGLALRKLFNE